MKKNDDERSHDREAAFMLIFEKLFRDDSCDDIIASAKEADEYDFGDNVCRIFKSVCEKSDEMDDIIAKFSTTRTVDRIGKVNLAILRLALYECLYEDSVPVNVAISEAVVLSRKYALDPDTAFINGVLGSFSRSELSPEKPAEAVQ